MVLLFHIVCLVTHGTFAALFGWRLSVGLTPPEQSGIQCLLHWRFTLNGNGIIRGNGTWGAEEDARLRKLAPVFSSPATGPRYVNQCLRQFLATSQLVEYTLRRERRSREALPTGELI